MLIESIDEIEKAAKKVINSSRYTSWNCDGHCCTGNPTEYESEYIEMLDPKIIIKIIELIKNEYLENESN